MAKDMLDTGTIDCFDEKPASRRIYASNADRQKTYRHSLKRAQRQAAASGTPSTEHFTNEKNVS
ncbi:hypothetical protein [Neptunomonas phycophila]|uniref:hypothetical protein n=1 Tax=Neptunomonas phycophila TaxID=1572645 RepID=UPI0035172CC0